MGQPQLAALAESHADDTSGMHDRFAAQHGVPGVVAFVRVRLSGCVPHTIQQSRQRGVLGDRLLVVMLRLDGSPARAARGEQGQQNRGSKAAEQPHASSGVAGSCGHMARCAARLCVLYLGDSVLKGTIAMRDDMYV